MTCIAGIVPSIFVESGVTVKHTGSIGLQEVSILASFTFDNCTYNLTGSTIQRYNTFLAFKNSIISVEPIRTCPYTHFQMLIFLCSIGPTCCTILCIGTHTLFACLVTFATDIICIILVVSWQC
jgi:hypothetical protein